MTLVSRTLLFLFLPAALHLSGCDDPNGAVADQSEVAVVQFDSETFGLGVGRTVAIPHVSETSADLGSTIPSYAARDRDGFVIYDRPVRFASSDTRVLRVNAGGEITGVSPGDAILTVEAGSVSSTLRVRVVPPYEITFVGRSPNQYSRGSGINQAGDVVGQACESHGLNCRPFIWSAGESILLEGGGAAYAVNDLGVVAGWNNGPAIWRERKGSAAAVDQNHRSAIYDIDDAERMVWGGISGSFCRGLNVCPVAGGALLRDGRVELPFLPHALNSDQAIVGYTADDNGSAQAMIWEEGAARALGSPGSTAYDINDAGLAVGYSREAPLRIPAYIWEDGVGRSIGILPRLTIARALAINEAGVIVGQSARGDEFSTSTRRATIWVDEVPMDLNDLVAGNEWRIEEASDINEAGQIVANAWNTRTGAFGALLLTP